MAKIMTAVAPLAQRMAQYLIAVQRATDVRITELIEPPAKEVVFTIAFTWRGQQRIFRYVIRRDDEVERLYDTLRVETQGELLVQQPSFELPHQFAENIIYYPVRG